MSRRTIQISARDAASIAKSSSLPSDPIDECALRIQQQTPATFSPQGDVISVDVNWLRSTLTDLFVVQLITVTLVLLYVIEDAPQ